MGQGQTKASKRHKTNGESPPSPKKEAKRSSKGSKSSRSPSKEREAASPLKEKQRESTPIEARETLIDDVEINPSEVILSESPRRLKITEREKPREVTPIEQEELIIEKENVPVSQINGVDSSPKTPVKMNIKESEPLTPMQVNNLENHFPQATSTPAPPNGIISSGEPAGEVYSDEEQDQTDQSDDEGFSSEQQFQFRTPSPTASSVSYSTMGSSALRSRSDSSYDRKFDVNYGKFYTTSYLKDGGGTQSYQKSRGYSSTVPKSEKSPHFHRPPNFSYSKDPPKFLQPKKGGMAQLATGSKNIVKVRRSSSPAAPTRIRNQEAVRFSAYPGGKPPPPKEIAKIEREDWPGPPSPAAILPEILRQRRRSRGEKDDEDEEEEVPEDPKIKREIEELSKFKDESGIGKIMFKELEEKKILPSKPLDPWKASRVPSAKYEPKYQTRFQSPMFASPSRFLDRPRRAWDDSDIRGYRTMSTYTHFPVMKSIYDKYGLLASEATRHPIIISRLRDLGLLTKDDNSSAPKPGYGEYGLAAPRAATLPVTGYFGGPLNFRFFDLDISDHDHGRHSTRTSSSSINTESSKRGGSSIFDGPGVSLLTFQRNTWHTAYEPTTYPYEQLKISNFDLPKDVDRNYLEIHLANDEFKEIFGMAKEEFTRLAEWKQNDMKRKKDLY